MTTEPLLFTLIFEARPGKAAELKKTFAEILEPTRREEGCLFYDLHVASDDPAKFLFYESWASPAHHAAHDRTPHIQKLLARIDELAFPPIKAGWKVVGDFTNRKGRI